MASKLARSSQRQCLVIDGVPETRAALGKHPNWHAFRTELSSHATHSSTLWQAVPTLLDEARQRHSGVVRMTKKPSDLQCCYTAFYTAMRHGLYPGLPPQTLHLRSTTTLSPGNSEPATNTCFASLLQAWQLLCAVSAAGLYNMSYCSSEASSAGCIAEPGTTH